MSVFALASHPCVLWAFSSLLCLSLVHEGYGISCIQCEADVALGGDDSCINNPPRAKPCDDDFMTVCMTIRTYMPAEEDKRALVSLVRTCSPTDMGWDCEKGKNDRGQIAEVCHDTCSWDGCNLASANLLSNSVWLVIGILFINLML